MKINEKGINMVITPEIKDFLYTKLAYLDKFINPADDSIMCDVELSMTTKHHRNGEIFKAEINLFMNGRTMRAVSEKEDILSAIDIVKDEIVREITVNKDKRIGLIRRGGSKVKRIIKNIFKN
jgi:ribosomal subunit interface protein